MQSCQLSQFMLSLPYHAAMEVNDTPSCTHLYQFGCTVLTITCHSLYYNCTACTIHTLHVGKISKFHFSQKNPWDIKFDQQVKFTTTAQLVQYTCMLMQSMTNTHKQCMWKLRPGGINRDRVPNLGAHVTQGGLRYRVLGIQTRREDCVKCPDPMSLTRQELVWGAMFKGQDSRVRLEAQPGRSGGRWARCSSSSPWLKTYGGQSDLVEIQIQWSKRFSRDLEVCPTYILEQMPGYVCSDNFRAINHIVQRGIYRCIVMNTGCMGGSCMGTRLTAATVPKCVSKL